MFCAITQLPVVLCAQAIPIAQARLAAPGSAVTVRGIVTSGAELGKIRYLQDATAGIAAYPGNGSAAGFESSVSEGDSIEVTGILTDYSGLLEITPVTAFQVLASNQPPPLAKQVSLAGLSDAFESQLVELDCISFSGPGGVFSGSGTYALVDPAGNSGAVYLRAGSPVLGAEIPQGPVRLQAILSQYGNYQLLPRTVADFYPAGCFHFLEQPDQFIIEPTRFQLAWETNLPATAVVWFDTTLSLNHATALTTPATKQVVWLEGLRPGQVYWARTAAIYNQDTIFSPTRAFATRSESSGQIKVYFNQGYLTTASNGLQPDGDTYAAVLAETLARIQAAQQTLDVAMYNNNRTDITNALKQAQSRGVRVRYIASSGTDNPSLQPSPPFPVLYGNNTGLMHNKFMVIDAGLPDRAWVMSGSMNWTTSNMIEDYNNTLFIQDQSLAQAYTLEFEEMWGSNAASPSIPQSRFGSAKTDNTPHHFVIAGRPVECWFSPSDQVTKHISDAIKTAGQQACFAIFSFTKDEIGNAFIAAQKQGAWVRGIMENINDPGAEYGWLLNNGVPVYPHPAQALLHHKYAVLDAGYADSDPTVVTGSHNWTQSAETNNDENTLVLHDDTLAILYQAEFERRWVENATATVLPETPAFDVFPNPASTVLYIRNKAGQTWNGYVDIRNGLGQLLRTEELSQNVLATIPLTGLPAGLYFMQLITDRGAAAFSIQTLPH